jgi:hypothetical protein
MPGARAVEQLARAAALVEVSLRHRPGGVDELPMGRLELGENVGGVHPG